MSLETFSPEITYGTEVSNHSSILYRTLQPQNSNSVTTSITSSVGPTTFQISPCVWNPSKSRLNFNITVPAQGAGNCANVNANLLTAISRIVVSSVQTGAILLDCSNFEKYASLITPASTKLDKFLTKSSYIPATNLPASVAASQLRTVEDISKNAVSSGNVTGANVDMAGENPYVSRRQLYTSPLNTAAYLDVSIPFEAFYNTFLALNRDIYHTENLNIDIYWNSINNYASLSTSVTNPTTGAASIATAFTLTNINLLLATESNLKIQASVMSKVTKEGMAIPIGYPTCIRQGTLSGSAHSFSINLTSAYGQSILGIITAAFSAAGTANVNNSHTRGTLTLYNTFLNSVPIKFPQGLSALLSQDYWVANKEHIEGSCIQTLGEYINGEWFHYDSFVKPGALWTLDDQVVDGLAMDMQQSTYQWQATLSGATDYIYVTAILGQKILRLTGQGIMI